MSELEFTISGTIPASRKEAFLEAILEAMKDHPEPPTPPIPEGATKMWITVPSEQEVKLYIYTAERVVMTVDWGDGSAQEELPWEASVCVGTHTFSAGEYTVSVWSDAAYELGVSSGNPIVLPKTALTTLQIGEGANAIRPGGCFQQTALRSVTAGDNLTTVSANSFYGCAALETADFGAGLTAINRNAFSGCTAIKSLTVCAATPPTLVASSITGLAANCVIYVPADSVAAYKAAQYWSARADYIQAIPA